MKKLCLSLMLAVFTLGAPAAHADDKKCHRNEGCQVKVTKSLIRFDSGPSRKVLWWPLVAVHVHRWGSHSWRGVFVYMTDGGLWSLFSTPHCDDPRRRGSMIVNAHNGYIARNPNGSLRYEEHCF